MTLGELLTEGYERVYDEIQEGDMIRSLVGIFPAGDKWIGARLDEMGMAASTIEIPQPKESESPKALPADEASKEAFIDELLSLINEVCNWNEDHGNQLPEDLVADLNNASFDAEGNQIWPRESTNESIDATDAKPSNHDGDAQEQRTLAKSDTTQATKPQPDSEGWIEWNGGECPTSPNDHVDVKRADGVVMRNRVAWPIGWEHSEGQYRITHYRLVPPAPIDCPKCDGSGGGVDAGNYCSACGGSGYYKGPRLGDEPCPDCNGDGIVHPAPEPCDCGGHPPGGCKEKQYRPFASAEEFEPFADRWFRVGGSEDNLRIIGFDNAGVSFVNDWVPWSDLFAVWEFTDGSYCGVEVK